MVASLCIDNDGTLWVAATGEGVYSYRFDTGKLTNYPHNPLPIRTVSATTTLTTLCRIVTATCGSPLPAAGLTVTAKESDDFENFDMQKDGLSSDCIYEVFESSIQKRTSVVDY